ncbi:Hypothetical predicted protein [Mytilus galloprovincialis]|uniref:Poly [ADP-ribose] polymerase n=1 Tax=Mytilus galloprovincialis TaxID=29158 RepID=A0A8B6DGG6_MYTGA|nr:Hypothetical predicted protein [Mytilus galloprovincialis]
MTNKREQDDDFLDLCEENSSPLADPGAINLPKRNLNIYDDSSSPLPDPMTKISSVKNEDLCISLSTCSDPDNSSLEDYSDIEIEDSSISPKKKSAIVGERSTFGKKNRNDAASLPSASELQTNKTLSSKYVQVISDESDAEKTEKGHVKKTTFEQSISWAKQKSISKSFGTGKSVIRNKVKEMSQWNTEENKTKSKTLIKRKPVQDDGGIINDVSPSKKLKPAEDKPKDEMDSLLNNVQRNDNDSVGNKPPKEVVIKAAIHLKEMFPDLGAGQIGDKIKAVIKINGTMSEQELIERVVEGICGNYGNATSEDIQIAIANPKIKISQNTQYKPVHKAKNQLSNSSKGKALLKRVVHNTDDTDIMDIDMDFGVEQPSYDGLQSTSPVTRPEVIETEPNKIKLRWKHEDTSEFPFSDMHTRYVVEIQAPPAREWTTLSRNIAGTVYVVSNLKPEQDYQFRVRASSLFGKLSEASPVAVFSRNIGKPTPVTVEKPEWYKAVDNNFSIINSYDQFPWFHGYLTRIEAENLLRYSSGRNGSFLVHKTDIGVKVIGVLYEGSVRHYKISQDTNGKLFISKDKKFSTLPDLIEHYSICNEELITPLQHCVPKVQESFTQPKEANGIGTKNETVSRPVDGEEVSSSTMMCEACQSLTSCDKIVQCCDGHLNCNTCVEKVVKKVLSHGSEETNITCCYNECFECNSYIPESQAKKVLPSLIFELLEDKINKKASETIEKMTDLYSCPICQYKVVIEGDLKKFDCPQCKSSTCRYCGKKWESLDHGGCTLNTFMANSDMDVTSTWCTNTLPEGYKDFRAVPLDTGQSEYNFVLSLFHKKGLRKGPSGQVKAVYSVQNPRLWQKFSLQKEHMIEDIGKDNINEQHLFHGTDTSAVGGICRDGLDWRMCGLNGTAFGQGTYFATDSSYSEKYSHIGTIRRNKSAWPKGFNLGSAYQRPSFGGNNAIPLPFTHGFSMGVNPPVLTNSNQNQGFGFGTTATNNNVSGFFGGTSNNQTSGSNIAQFLNHYRNIRQSQPPINSATNPPGFGFGGAAAAATFGAANNFTFGAQPVNFANTNVNITGQEASSTGQSEDIPLEEQFIQTTSRYMFLARVLVGRPCQGQNGMRKPPRDEQNRLYNSASDNPAKPSIFVVFDSAQCYPEYLIEL